MPQAHEEILSGAVRISNRFTVRPSPAPRSAADDPFGSRRPSSRIWASAFACSVDRDRNAAARLILGDVARADLNSYERTAANDGLDTAIAASPPLRRRGITAAAPTAVSGPDHPAWHRIDSACPDGLVDRASGNRIVRDDSEFRCATPHSRERVRSSA